MSEVVAVEVDSIPSASMKRDSKYMHLFKQLIESKTGILKVVYENKEDARALAQYVAVRRRDFKSSQRGKEVYLSISEGGK